MAKDLVKQENGVEMWRIAHPAPGKPDAFLVLDPDRTPEEWQCWTQSEAEERFQQRLNMARA